MGECLRCGRRTLSDCGERWCPVCGHADPPLPECVAQELRLEAEAGERQVGRPMRVVAVTSRWNAEDVQLELFGDE